jgi:hypothetical protein
MKPRDFREKYPLSTHAGSRRRLLIVYCTALLLFLYWFLGTGISPYFLLSVLTKPKGHDPRTPAHHDAEANEPEPTILSPPKKKNAVASNLQNENYVQYALVLGYTIQKYNPIFEDGSTDMVLLVPYDNNVTELSMSRLKAVGWNIRYEDDIAVPGTEWLHPLWQRNFIKLRVWNWIEYRKIALFDADTMVMGDISLLLSDGFGKSSSHLLNLILWCKIAN